ncbi:MAG TPA: LysM peptidoglycan-binding domain-containing protein [Solirubrobacterales bacterium]|jgi:LysM repeat protein
MNRTSKYTVRLLAVLAIAAVAVAVVVIVSSFKSDSNDKTGTGKGKAHPAKQHQEAPKRTTAKTYTVQSGDTLTAIAHKTGVTVAELQALNPEIDPQILIAGEVLKLR